MRDVTVGQVNSESAIEFARSEVFLRMFQEGMALVEETAAYLDGAGRDESKSLSRNAALSYAGESMRLTTRLMQVASWLLVQRAVREDELAPEEAAKDKYRIGAKESAPDFSNKYFLDMPEALRDLIARADRLYERVSQIDDKLYRHAEPAPQAVAGHLSKLREAFADL